MSIAGKSDDSLAYYIFTDFRFTVCTSFVSFSTYDSIPTFPVGVRLADVKPVVSK